MFFTRFFLPFFPRFDCVEVTTGQNKNKNEKKYEINNSNEYKWQFDGIISAGKNMNRKHFPLFFVANGAN